jgi:hypothetical protein
MVPVRLQVPLVSCVAPKSSILTPELMSIATRDHGGGMKARSNPADFERSLRRDFLPTRDVTRYVSGYSVTWQFKGSVTQAELTKKTGKFAYTTMRCASMEIEGANWGAVERASRNGRTRVMGSGDPGRGSQRSRLS